MISIQSAAIIYTTTVGDQATPIVAARPGKKIRVFSFAVSISINGSQCFMRSGAGGVQLSELFLRTISGSTIAAYYSRTAYDGIMLFETNVGQALVLNCSTAASTNSVQVVYAYV